jgi:hypothetical protein
MDGIDTKRGVFFSIYLPPKKKKKEEKRKKTHTKSSYIHIS